MEKNQFIGVAHGYGGEIELEVTVENTTIKAIRVVRHSETKGISDPAFEYVIAAMVEQNSVCVPNVAGCSISSMALKRAAADALQKAGMPATRLNSLIEDSQTLEKISSGKKHRFKSSYDVIVIGSGGAGLTAAISARMNGVNVLVLEKRNAVGGNTLVSMGGVNIPQSDAQFASDISDSKELYYNDIITGGDHENVLSQVHILVENAHPTYQWLKEEIGVEFKEKSLIHFGGHSVPRATVFQGKYAIELIGKLRQKAEDLGVKIACGVSVEDLIYEDARVQGVITGNATIKATMGVVLATGGFSGNQEMRMKYDSSLDARYKTTNVSGILGEGHLMAERLHAQFKHMNYIQTFPIANPLTGELSHVGGSRFDGAILVNKQGERFVEELGRRDIVSEGILAQEGNIAYLLWSKEIEEVNHPTMQNEAEVVRLQRDGLFVKADTLEECAQGMGICVDSLQKTVQQYNNYVAQGKDEQFHRRGSLISIAHPPFYIQVVAPSVHHTMGGVVINEKSQVLDADNNIIKGLYAAGEIVGGTHGTNRLGGNAITEILVFGKRAGDFISSQ